MEYKEVQKIAKDTIEYAKKHIESGMNLLDIRKICEEKMIELGADSFWYWDIGAFVFSGDETVLSVSGKNYRTSQKVIGEQDMITIDLTPQIGNTWGDYARTLVVENGIVVETENVHNSEWKNGLLMEEYLHHEMCRFVTPDRTFEELHYYINNVIEKGATIDKKESAEILVTSADFITERILAYVDSI